YRDWSSDVCSSDLRCAKALFHVGGKKIKRLNGKNGESHGDSPVNVGPQKNKKIGKVNPGCKPCAKTWTHDHHRERNQQQSSGEKRQTDRQRSRLPERTFILDFISQIQSFDRRGKTTRS